MSRRITVEFLGKDTTLSRTAGQVEARTSRLGSRLATVGKVAAIGFAGGVAVAGKSLFEMGKNAAEDEANQRRLAVALRNTTNATDAQVKGVEDWISAQGRALGVTDDELRPAFQRLAQATGDISKAQDLARIAMDASAGSGKSLKVVTEAMAKAQNGNLGALSKLGIKIKNADGSMKSFTQITKEMSRTFGGQASAQADSFQGRMDRLKLMFDETKETIGSKLLPVVDRLSQWFINEGLPAIQKFGGWLQSTLGPIFDGIGAVVRRVTGGMKGDVGKSFADIKAIFSSAISIISSLWNTFGGTLVTYAKRAFGAVRQIISGALTAIRGIFQFWSNVLKGNWKGAWDSLKTILRGAWQAIGGIVRLGWAAVRAIFGLAITTLKAVFRGAWDGLRTIASNGWQRVQDFLSSIPGKIKDLGGKFKEAGRWLIDKMLDGISNAAGFVSDIAGNIWSAVKRLLNNGIDRINSALEFTVKIPGPVPDVHIDPPNIPHLAKGGIVRARPGGTLALIGEAGHDEAVVPLSGPHAPKGVGGGGHYVIDLRLDGKVIQRLLLAEKRRGGGLELGLA